MDSSKLKNANVFERVLILEYILKQYENYESDTFEIEEIEKLNWILNEISYFKNIKINNNINFQQLTLILLSLNENTSKTLENRINFLKSISSHFKDSNLVDSLNQLETYILYLNDYFTFVINDDYNPKLFSNILLEISNRNIILLINSVSENIRKKLLCGLISYIDCFNNKGFELLNMLIANNIITKDFIQKNRKSFSFGHFRKENIIYMLEKKIIDENQIKNKISKNSFDLGNFDLFNWSIKKFNFSDKEFRKITGYLFEYSFDYCQQESNNSILEMIQNDSFKLNNGVVGLLKKYLSDEMYGRENILDCATEELEATTSEIHQFLLDLKRDLEVAIEEIKEDKSLNGDDIYIDDENNYETGFEGIMEELDQVIDNLSYISSNCLESEEDIGVIPFDKKKLIDDITLILIDKIKTKEDEDLVLDFYNSFETDEVISKQRLVKTLTKILNEKDKNTRK